MSQRSDQKTLADIAKELEQAVKLTPTQREAFLRSWVAQKKREKASSEGGSEK